MKLNKTPNILLPFMPQPEDEIGSECHTLFVDKQVFEVNNYQLYIDDFAETGRGLHKIFNTLYKASGDDSISVTVNSNGGSVYEGMQFYNLIRNVFNGRTITYLDPVGASMGALMFCMGDKRVCYEHSSIMFHDYSSGTWGKSQTVEADVTHHKKTIHNFFNKLIVKSGFMTEEEFEEMKIGREFWWDAPEMCRRGVCTHVIRDGAEYTVEEYMKEFSEDFPELKRKGIRAKVKKVAEKVKEFIGIEGNDNVENDGESSKEERSSNKR